jgi:hypothetical protein
MMTNEELLDHMETTLADGGTLTENMQRVFKLARLGVELCEHRWRGGVCKDCGAKPKKYPPCPTCDSTNRDCGCAMGA